MKQLLTITLLLLSFLISCANTKDSIIYYSLPDSVKAISFMAEMSIPAYEKKKSFKAGIKTDAAILTIENRNGRRGIEFHSLIYPNQSIMGLHIGMDLKIGGMVFNYEWKINETYKLLISQAADSAGNFSLYSGYVFLPGENKWKLVGTCRIDGRWSTLQQPSSFSSWSKKS